MVEVTAAESPPDQEFVIGLVGAVGTDLELVDDAVRESIQQFNFTPVPLRISDFFLEFEEWKNLPREFFDDRLKSNMRAGTELRKLYQLGDALAVLAIGAIRDQRWRLTNDVQPAVVRRAYILRSLKHPEEATTLRRIYGSSFVLVAAYTPRSTRRYNLSRRIANSRGGLQADQFAIQATQLMETDESEAGTKLGQNVRETFPMADVFVNAMDPEGLRKEVDRFFSLLFGCSFHTPTRDEYGMFHAHAAALRSASLARQVGAVIASPDGEILAVGTNEVPKPGGGLYWEGDSPDQRDFMWGYDISDQFRRNVLTDVLNKLQKGQWLVPGRDTAEAITQLVDSVLEGEPCALTGTSVMNSIEFVRAVHAEMAAIVDAARRGGGVRGCTLYTTTFPCHDCAKHIVAAGIQRLVYIHPYPKSLAQELHPDSIVLDSAVETKGRVKFEPFVGIAPRRYMDIFTPSGKRKNKDGKIVTWNKLKSLPRLGEGAPSYLARLVGEEEEFSMLAKKMSACEMHRIHNEEVGNA